MQSSQEGSDQPIKQIERNLSSIQWNNSKAQPNGPLQLS